MQVEKTLLPGVLILRPKVFRDSRGYFVELYNAESYQRAGVFEHFVQDNLSRSQRGVIRGLHFQNPQMQGKLVGVITGEVFDVTVDIRPNSPTYKQWVSVRLDAESHVQVYIPPGYAHGFCVLSEEALFYYKCTDLYNPKAEHTIKWDDPEIGIKWPISEPTISPKDAAGCPLQDFPREHLPRFNF